MKVFVTGGTGSIGAHVVKLLSDQGHDIHVLARNVKKAESLGFPGVTVFKGDILDAVSVKAAIKGCEQVYHLAAFVKVWAKDTAVFYDVNVVGTQNVLDAALEVGVKRTVVTGTASVLGPSLRSVITEKKSRDIDLFNEYEGSKLAFESKVKDYIIQHDMDIVIVSPTRVFGPILVGASSSITLMIEKYINKSWRLYPGTGKELGNYAYIEDVALGHLLAMEKGRKGHTYILGGENCDYVDFYRMISELSGVNVKLWVVPHWLQVTVAKYQVFKGKYLGGEALISPKWIAKGTYNWVVDPKKAIDELGLPITPIKEALRKTIESLQKKN